MLLKTTEVAALLRVHPKQIYRLLEQGLPARRVGSEWRFVRSEVLAWSQTGEAIAPAGAPVTPTSSTSTLLAANGDVVIDLLLEHIAAAGRTLVGFVPADRGEALRLLEAQRVLMAGYHGDAHPPQELQQVRLARIHLVRRHIGLAYAPGEKTRLRRLGDFLGLPLALRPATAGVRVAFDAALEAEGLAKKKPRGAVYPSHREAVFAVLRGEAKAALTTSAWAERVGLGFFSLGEEDYDLLLRARDLGDPAAVAACETAQGKPFRAALRGIAGYDAKHAGTIRYFD
ncbi:MAG: helix-turn-helix transcriptional regulator [Polyangiaceae bacterium]|nr:helix-turn-helix transcriptional regulator [Polyangiaceae bacterium]